MFAWLLRVLTWNWMRDCVIYSTCATIFCIGYIGIHPFLHGAPLLSRSMEKHWCRPLGIDVYQHRICCIQVEIVHLIFTSIWMCTWSSICIACPALSCYFGSKCIFSSKSIAVCSINVAMSQSVYFIQKVTFSWNVGFLLALFTELPDICVTWSKLTIF